MSTTISANSLANLASQHGMIGRRAKCAHCGQPAMRGARVCRWHAGNKRLPDTGGRVERRLLNSWGKVGLLPGDLLATPTYRALGTLPQVKRSPMRHRLVMLWHVREVEALAFAQAWRDAAALAREARPGKGWAWG